MPRLECPHCRTMIAVRDSYLGRQFRCPMCATELLLDPICPSCGRELQSWQCVCGSHARLVVVRKFPFVMVMFFVAVAIALAVSLWLLLG